MPFFLCIIYRAQILPGGSHILIFSGLCILFATKGTAVLINLFVLPYLFIGFVNILPETAKEGSRNIQICSFQSKFAQEGNTASKESLPHIFAVHDRLQDCLRSSSVLVQISQSPANSPCIGVYI